ncbi:MAG: WG repeat-containing protein [Planctomycetota bacterium]
MTACRTCFGSTPTRPLTCRKPRIFRDTVKLLGHAAIWLTATAGHSQSTSSSELGIRGEAASPGALRFADPGPNDDLLEVNLNGYWGLINTKGRIIAFPRYDWTEFGVDGLARATLNGGTGFILGNGRWRFDPIYPYADRFEQGFAIVGDGEKFGFIDVAGRTRMGFELDGALRFKENRAAVRVGNRVGYLDTSFRLATPMQFTAGRSYHDGLAAVRLPLIGNATGTDAPPGVSKPPDSDPRLQTKGELVDAPEPLDPAYAAEKTPKVTEGKWGYIDLSGRMVYLDKTGKIEELGDFNENVAKFKMDGKWGYLDQKFRVAVPPLYEDARDFTNGVAAVKSEGKWGYIDRRFELVIAHRFEEADDFDETLAMVRLNGLVGFVGRSGKLEIEPRFKDAQPFRLDSARVQIGNSFGYILTSGYVLLDPRNARFGIVDITSREQLRVRTKERSVKNRVLKLRPPRPPVPPPYPPDFLYDEGLFLPADRNP